MRARIPGALLLGGALFALAHPSTHVHAETVANFGLGSGLPPGSRCPARTLFQTWHSGTSLSYGNFGTPVLSTTETYGNLALFDTSGNFNDAGAATWEIISSAAPIRTLGSDVTPYPQNLVGEIFDSAAGDEFTALAEQYGCGPLNLVETNTGQENYVTSDLAPGGASNSYGSGLMELTVDKNIQIDAGQPDPTVLVTWLTTGEQDAVVDSPSPSYQTTLQNYQSSLQSGVAAITGQAITPLLVDQQHSYPVVGVDDNIVASQQLSAAELSTAANPIYFTGPKYWLTYQGDNTHPYNTGYRIFGEKTGEVLWWLATGRAWVPFAPVGFGTNAANTYASDGTIVVPLTVPQPPIVNDGTATFATAPHQSGLYAAWALGNGFEVYDHILGTVTSCTGLASPIVFTMATALPAYVATGQSYTIWNVHATNNTTAAYLQATWTITVVSAVAGTFSLNGSTAQTGTCLSSPQAIVAQLPTINAVAISGNAIVVSANRAVYSDATISYAQTPACAYAQPCAGYAGGLGRYGLYHDSDRLVGIHSGAAEPNWLAAFTAHLVVPRLASASSVSHLGGTSTIAGTGFLAGCSATIDGQPTTITCTSATAASLTVPATTAGTHTVLVRNPIPNPSDSGSSGAAILTTT